MCELLATNQPVKNATVEVMLHKAEMNLKVKIQLSSKTESIYYPY